MGEIYIDQSSEEVISEITLLLNNKGKYKAANLFGFIHNNEFRAYQSAGTPMMHGAQPAYLEGKVEGISENKSRIKYRSGIHFLIKLLSIKFLVFGLLCKHIFSAADYKLGGVTSIVFALIFFSGGVYYCRNLERIFSMEIAKGKVGGRESVSA